MENTNKKKTKSVAIYPEDKIALGKLKELIARSTPVFEVGGVNLNQQVQVTDSKALGIAIKIALTQLEKQE